MDIACPQCSMKYALDPRLLPPGGVPVQCTRCSHVFIAGATEPAPAPKPVGAPARPSHPLNSTVLYGTNSKPSASASPLSTQAFGAVPQVAPVVPRIQPVAPAVAPVGAPAASPASQVHKTQAFGAVPQIPPAGKPAAPRPAGKPAAAPARPSLTAQAPVGAPGDASALKTTQAFGAVPVPVPAVPKPAAPAPRPAAPRPVSVSLPLTGAPSTTSPAERLVPWEPVPALASPPPGEPSASAPLAKPPGMVPRGPASERPSREVASTPFAARPSPEFRMGVAATTPIELPDEILAQLDRPLSELMGQEEPDAPAPSPAPAPPASGPTLSKPLELPPELLDRPLAQARDTRPKKSRAGQGLLIAGGILVLALTAFLTSPAWRSRADVLPQPVQVARDEAVAKLRRDDAVSQQEAIAELKSLSAAHPQSVELLAELGIAFALHLDDTQVRLTTLRAQEKGLSAVIERLTSTRTPQDWQSRANTLQEELTGLQQRGYALDASVRSLSTDTMQVLKRLEVVPEKEPREPALARLRGRAMVNATLGVASTSELAVKLAQAELRDWSSLVMAEYVLHLAAPSAAQSQDAAAAMEQLRAKNSTSLRAYVLGARLALLRHEPASAQALLDTVITLNPKHELAQELHAYIQELRTRAAEPQQAPAPERTPTPAPTPAPTLEAAPPSSPPTSPPPQGSNAAGPGPEGTSAPGGSGG